MGEGDLFSAAMKKVALFSFFSDEQMLKVWSIVKIMEYEAGEEVFKEGDPGDSLFLVKDGMVKAVAKGFFVRKTLKTMGPGEIFGLLGLTLKQPRKATIVCAEATTCFVLEREDLDILIKNDPGVAAAFKNVINDRFQKYN
jgi:CRP-like cAMP-binding protein